MLVFCPYWYRSETLAFLVMIVYDLAFGMNNKGVENFLRFLESLGSPLWDGYNRSYG
jgi:hypothetical protein